MARKRMIDPKFWEDGKIGSLEPLARLLFMGLISQSDDEGRLNGHPSLIKSSIFPYDGDITIEKVEGWLEQLSGFKLIIRYEIDFQKYIQVTNFIKHQTINRPQVSKLPPPFTEESVNVHSNDAIIELIDQNNNATNELNDHAQKKLKEEKLKEDKLKENKLKEIKRNVREESDDDIRSSLHKLINDCKIEKYTLHDLEIIFSYIGDVDVEVIEAAIKKASGKEHINYAIRTLEGMIKQGKTKKEHLFTKAIPEPGMVLQSNPSGRTRSGKPNLPIVESNAGSNVVSAEELEEMRKLARKLDSPNTEAVAH
ncbi:hypothetical protein EBB07_00060 [Paenibacillaceae bacterium]|nr:hypothetical protein EBB07_00060 [Paenibacillaceae bacterium]